MTLLGYEIKKLLGAPAVIGFIVVCIVANAAVILAYGKPWHPEGEVTPEPTDVFADYSTSDVAEYYIGRYSVTGKAAENIRGKYEKLQPVIDEKSADGDSLSVYLGLDTAYTHELLFGIVLKLTFIEACVAALFTAMLSAGFEAFFGTEGIVAASGTGRRVMLTKTAASLISAVIVFIALCVFTLTVFFAIFDFSGVWGENVSSAFNQSPHATGNPFITWHSFTVLGLLCAFVLAGIALTLCFALFGFAVGTFIRSGYGASAAAIVLCFTSYIAEAFAPVGSHIRNALTLNPLYMWTRIDDWFTEGSADIIIANFESVGLAISLAILAAITGLAQATYKRRAIV
jgi:hypothetical protein